MKLGHLNSNFKTKKHINSRPFIFQNFGNLIYFDKLKPDYFYFNTLLSDYEMNKPNPRYRSKANSIGQQALSILGSSPLINDDNLENTIFYQRIEQAQKILQAGILYEHQNEKNYIERKIKELEKNIDKNDKEQSDTLYVVKNLLQKLNSSEGIDYLALINLINILRQGLKNTQAIYKDNKRHIEEVNKQYEIAKEKYISQQEGLDASGKNKSLTPSTAERRRQRFENQSKKIYLNHKTFVTKNPNSRIAEILNSNMRDVRNIDSILAETVTNTIKKILESKKLYNKIQAQITLKTLQKNYLPTEEEIKHIIVTDALKMTSKNIHKILNKEIDFNGIAEEIAKYFTETETQTFDIDIEGFYDNFGFLGKHLDFFKKGTDWGEGSAKGLYEAVEELYKNVRTTNEKLTPEQQWTKENLGRKFSTYIKLIHKIEAFSTAAKKDQDNITEFSLTLPGEKRGEKVEILLKIDDKGALKIEGDFLKSQIGKALGFKSFKPKTLESMITTLKKRISLQIKQQLTSIILKTTSKTLEKQAKEQLKQGLENIRVSIGGPKWSEIIVQIQASLKSGKILAGPVNLKTDNITIECFYDEDSYSFDLSLSPSEVQNIAEAAEKEIQEKEKTFLKEYQTAVMADLQEFGSKKSKKYNKFIEYSEKFQSQNNIRLSYIEKTKKTIKQLDKEFEKGKIDEKEYKIKKQKEEAFLDELENSIYISSTSKTYNNYMDQIGFIGGSVGASIVEQIDNLNQLFTEAGVPLNKKEENWLISAAINNSSLSVIGHKNESIIENYLGSLATFALFSESGAEMPILKKIAENKKISKESGNIIHLYFVNGAYYPGSYVLQQASNHIDNILNNIQTIFSDNNSSFENGVKITNTVNFSDIPNTSNYKNKNAGHNTHPWKTVSQTAKNKTKINILFLAGLLDLVRKLNDELNEIEIPS